MNTGTTGQTTPGQRLAYRLNLVPIGLFAIWLGQMLMFWAQAFGPLLPFGTPPAAHSALPWFVASVLAGTLVLLLPARWYDVQPFENSGRAYVLAGVSIFRRFVTNGDLINNIVTRRHPNYRVYSYSVLVEALRADCLKSERAHLVAFASGAAATIYAVVIEWHGWAIWLALSNLLGNLYPALVQRQTRIRLRNIRCRLRG